DEVGGGFGCWLGHRQVAVRNGRATSSHAAKPAGPQGVSRADRWRDNSVTPRRTRAWARWCRPRAMHGRPTCLPRATYRVTPYVRNLGERVFPRPFVTLARGVRCPQ